MADLVKQIQLTCPDIVRSMMENTHAWSSSKLNPHHIESNTWSHVMMTTLVAEMLRVSKTVKIAILLHDIGKPLATVRLDDKEKVTMYGHEGMSVFLGLKFLSTLDLTSEEKVRICQLISLHTYLYKVINTEMYQKEISSFFNGNKALLLDLISMTMCDSLGRYAEVEDREFWENANKNFADVIEMTDNCVVKKETNLEAVVLVGPPMSGKSTYVKQHLSNYIVLSRDNIIMEMSQGKSYNDAYKEMNVAEVDTQFNKRKIEAIKASSNIVFDLTHMSKKSRRRALAGIPSNYKKIAVVFLVQYEELLLRNDIRTKGENKTIPLKVLHDMMGSFSFPLISEGFDEVRVIFDNDK